jgi:DNA-binding MarR family transcriptional regulator
VQEQGEGGADGQDLRRHVQRDRESTLAALPDGDALSFTRLQDMLELTPGNLISQLRKLEEADYISSTKTRNGSAQKTTVALTSHGRAALRAYTRALRDLLGGLDGG